MQTKRTRATVFLCAVWSLIALLPRADATTGAAPIPPRTIAPPPAPVFDVRTYGATGNGTSYDTAAIQAAINACAGTGGSVLLSGGSFVSAALELKGNMTFYVATGATLLGGLEVADYPQILPYTVQESLSAIWNKRSLLYANLADGLKLDGGGTIDGRGAQVKIYGEGGFMGSNAGNRPSILRIFQSKDVVVRNLDVKNPRMWTMIYDRCERLLIEHLDINAPAYYANLDGMDILDSRDVTIRNCVVESEDDAICLKSHSLTGMKNIVITNNVVTCHNANAFKIGTATLGPIENILIENNTVKGAELGGVCIESVDGSLMDGVVVRGLKMEDVGQPVFIRLGNRPDWRTATPNHRAGPGSIRNVTVEDVHITDTHGRTQPSNTVTGIYGARLENIVLRDIHVEMPGGLAAIPATPVVSDEGYPQSNIFGNTPAYGFYVRHANGVRFENITIGSVSQDPRKWMVSQDASVEVVNCTDFRHIYALSNTTLDPHDTIAGLPEVVGLRAGNTYGQTFSTSTSPVTLERVRVGYGALAGAATATTLTLTVDVGNNGGNELSKAFTLAPADLVRLVAAPYSGIAWLDLDVSELGLQLPVGTHSFLLTVTSVTGAANTWLLAPAYTNTGAYGGGALLGSVAASNRDANFAIISSPPDADSDGLHDTWEASFPGIAPGDLSGMLPAGSGPGSGTGDYDGDGHSDLQEFNSSTNPTLSDTDGDGLGDGDEVRGLRNPYSGATAGSLPGDATDPLVADSDGDTIPDGEEVIPGTDGFTCNPNRIDTDGDLYSDQVEVEAGSFPNNASSIPIGIPIRDIGFQNTTGWLNRGGTTVQSGTALLAGSGSFALVDMATFNNGVVISYPNPSSTVFCSADFRVDGTFGSGTGLANFNSGGTGTTSSSSTTHCIVRLFQSDRSIQAYNGTSFLGVVPAGGIVSGVTYTVQIEHDIPGLTYGVRVFNRNSGALIGSISGVPTRATANPLADPMYFSAGTQAVSGTWDLAVDNMKVSLSRITLGPPVAPRITSAGFNNQRQFVIQFTGNGADFFDVKKSLNLQAGSFLPLGTPLVVGTDANGLGQAIVPAAEATAPAAFFRLEER